ncbi:MAG: flagellar motor switch protein FliY [Campylobacterota bacterium]
MSWIELFSGECAATIEGLIGQKPEVELKSQQEKAMASAPMSMTYIDVSGDYEGKMAVAITPAVATALSDMMLGGEGESQNDMTDDDLDATKEIVSNIFGAISTSLGGQQDMPKLNFSISDIEFFEEKVEVSDFTYSVTFHFVLGVINGEMNILFDEALKKSIAPQEESSQPASQSTGAPSGTESLGSLSPEQQKNINLLMDVKLPVKVRIGTKKMLLKDVLAMDIGSVVELDQLANDPLEILVDDIVIAMGEVVIVDGNFGIQVTEIGSKAERLQKLKNG